MTAPRRMWRGLDELADSDELRELVAREFPEHASEWHDPITRRQFLSLMGASLALAGLVGCTRQPEEKIVPYVRPPEEIIPGRPLKFATALTRGGYATGVLAESHEGRPTRLDGNPDHPASLGALDAVTQAEILALYDPDRSQVPTHLGSLRSMGDLDGVLRMLHETAKAKKGAGLRILTETVTSPTLAAALDAFLAAFPEARWHPWDALGRHGLRAGMRAAFGQDVEPVYRLEKADVIVALDADFLGPMTPGAVRYARELASRRRIRLARQEMSRLYAVESCPTITGARADQRLPLRPGDLARLASELVRAVGAVEKGGSLDKPGREAGAAWVAAAAKDLVAARGKGLVIAGEDAHPAVHHAAAALNQALGNVGATVDYIPAVAARPEDQAASLKTLCDDLRADRVETLVILGGNPVYTAPADLDFAGAVQKAGLRVHLGLHVDETAIRSHWHIPQAHELECWGDARAFDGTASIQQPLIAPLYGGRSALETLSQLATGALRPGYDQVRAFWKARTPAGDDWEAFWRRSVHDGLVTGSAPAPKSMSLKALLADPPAAEAPSGRIDVVLRPDPCVLDGRHANNGWLQELPKPITKLVWDNAVLLSPALAARFPIRNEEVVSVSRGGRSVRGPAWIVPGHADDTVTVHLGYGRARTGRVGAGAGFDAGPLRTTDGLAGGPGELAGTLSPKFPAEWRRLACTQLHHAMEGRDLVRAGTLEEYRRDPAFAAKRREDPDRPRHGGGAKGGEGGHEAGRGEAPGPEAFRKLSLYPERPRESPQWAMAIDLGTCTGCSACVVACQSENNSPVVGKEQVLLGREMHWIRIDRYFEGAPEAPAIHHQPMLCQQCEDAPCEVVCPANATTHSPEGLNEMIYNRCIGTRFCSNNCPYKVRRFNFLAYSGPVESSPVLQLLMNPDVTVRTRGVMEKCTFCVQRVNAARIEAKKEGRAIRDGEVVTACEAACPAEAIRFGDLCDPKSRVALERAEPGGYGVLAERGTRPRITYLPSVRNPGAGAEERPG